jgi:hypothetical protein
MTEICEGVAVLPAEKAETKKEKKEKQPKKIRITLFFDGTLNNRTNIEAREDNSQHYLDNTEPSSSYENGRTNVAIMETHMTTDIPAGYDYFESVYTPGQGTFDLEGDSLWGYAMGAGESGVKGRAKLGIQQALSVVSGIDSGSFDPNKHFIEKLTLDVFGFSRGAATARYAIYLLLKDKNNFCVRLKKLGFDIEEEAVEVGFAGLYDTVLSYMASQKFKSSRNKLEQTAHKYANKVVHLASADEHRKDFPLHDISCSKSKGGEEYYLPGVHSDVGGSYNKADENKVSAETDNIKKRALLMVMNEEDMTINRGSLEKIETDKAWLIDQGWYKPANTSKTHIQNQQETKEQIKQLERRGHQRIKIEDGEFIIRLFYRRLRNELIFTYATLSVKRSDIYSGYANIPLKIMADFVKKEPKLTIKPKMKKRADAVIDICSLTDLESKIVSYVAGKPDSKAEDWLDSPEIKKYRNKQLNFSAFRAIGYAPRFSGGKRKRFIYDA